VVLALEALEMSAGTRSLASKRTSPVSRSTTSAAKRALSRSEVLTFAVTGLPCSRSATIGFDSVMPAKTG
jgi:hypothetical protein